MSRAAKDTPKSLKSLLAQLQSSNAIERTQAVMDISRLTYINREIAGVLEQAAVNDTSQSVRLWAKKALESPAYKAIQSGPKKLDGASKELLVDEIRLWKKEGLINAKLAEVLSARYSEQPAVTTPAPEVAPTPEPATQSRPIEPARRAEPKRSLSEILFSQTAINIALFLGAFFVLAAALILAALNAFLRIPVLFGVTVVFLGGALGFRRRQPTASLTLFVVYSLLVPIFTNVVLETAALGRSLEQLTWLLVTAFLTANWAFATTQYHSRLFAVLTFAGFNSLPIQLVNWIGAPSDLTLFLASLANVASLVAAFRIKKRGDQMLFTPVYGVSQIWQVLLLMSSIPGAALNIFTGAQFPIWTLATCGALLAGSVYYHLSYRENKSPIFPYLAIACLLGIPWLVVQILNIASGPATLVTWVWGSTFALVGHWLSDLKKSLFQGYGRPLLWGSGILYVVAAISVIFGVSGILPQVWWAFVIFLGIALIYSLLTIGKRRDLIWGAALLAYFFAYWSFLSLPFFQDTSAFIGFLFLWPVLGFLSIELVSARYFAKEKVLQEWPRAYGWILAGVLAFILFREGDNDPLRVSISLAILAGFIAIYAAIRKVAVPAYLSLGALAAAATYLLLHLQIENLTFPLLALGAVYYLSGHLLLRQKGPQLWARPLHITGLGLIGAMALLQPGATAGQQNLIVFVISVAAFLFADLSEHQRKGEKANYRVLVRLSTIGISAYSLALSFGHGASLPLEVGIAYVIYALSFQGSAILRSSPNITYLAVASSAVALVFVLDYFGMANPIYPLMGLGTAYAVGGIVLFRERRWAAWARVVHYAGLGLIGAVTLSQFATGSGQQQLISSVYAVVAFVLADLAEGRRKPSLVTYRNASRIAALALSVFSLITIYNYGQVNPLAVAIALFVYAVLFLIYSIYEKAPRVAFISTTALAVGAIYLQNHFNLGNWLPGLAAFSVLYLAGAYLPKWGVQKRKPWKKVLEASTSALNVFIAFGAFWFADSISVVCLAIAATAFGVQAFREKKISKAVLADLLYLEGYLLALSTLNVAEPQFYSIGAAILGLVMHYMLMRSDARSIWTFVAGMLSQLVLLGTTFSQMLSTEELQYFFILFFQALAVIAYGVVIRSRSLVLVPIGFTILAVITVIYSRLSGISTLLIIGCTGFSLLFLAIAALFLRERISDTTERVRARLSGWSA